MKVLRFILAIIGALLIVMAVVPLAQIDDTVKLYESWPGDYGTQQLPKGGGYGVWLPEFTVNEMFLIDHVTIRLWASVDGDYHLKLYKFGCSNWAIQYAMTTEHKAYELRIGNCGWLEKGTYSLYMMHDPTYDDPGFVYINPDPAFVVWGGTWSGGTGDGGTGDGGTPPPSGNTNNTQTTTSNETVTTQPPSWTPNFLLLFIGIAFIVIAAVWRH